MSKYPDVHTKLAGVSEIPNDFSVRTHVCRVFLIAFSYHIPDYGIGLLSTSYNFFSPHSPICLAHSS